MQAKGEERNTRKISFEEIRQVEVEVKKDTPNVVNFLIDQQNYLSPLMANSMAIHENSIRGIDEKEPDAVIFHQDSNDLHISDDEGGVILPEESHVVTFHEENNDSLRLK